MCKLPLYAIFLTDVVGLSPILASFPAIIGGVWDAINDPLIGMLSDRVRTRWGRRRPFLLFFAIPFGLSFLLLWYAPPFESQVGTAIFITMVYIIADTMETLVAVPFAALTPELTRDYDERTSLTGFRMFFNLLISLVTAVAAPQIVNTALRAGLIQQQGYLIVGAIFGGMAAIPFLLICAVVREPDLEPSQTQQATFMETVRTAWGNVPFRYATLLYMLNWITFDIVTLALPYYLVYWISRGNLLAEANILGVNLPIESAVFALLLITSVLVLPFWIFIANRFSKQMAYMAGMIFWAVVQLVIFAIQPGQVVLILAMSVLAGISVSSAHLLPDSIFPDVIEWDELRTRRRSEGMYYGVKNFIRKLTGALAIFIGLQVLGWFGYQNPPADVTRFVQPDSALLGIRVLIGPLGAVLLFSAILMARFYPLTRERHARIRRLLEQRKTKAGVG